jgi:hypothetical protein
VSSLYPETRGLVDDAPLDTPGQQLLGVWKNRREQALHERRKYEPTWAICESFLAGRQWVSWSTSQASRTGRVVSEPNPGNRERHTVNVITNYVQTILGKLFVEDLRPTVVFTRDDNESESISSHTRAMARYLWDVELQADSRLHEVLLSTVTYGTAALRCYFDTTKGEEIGEFPVGPDGQPIVDINEAREYVAQAAEQGYQVPFKPLREGKVTIESLHPRHLLVPPGIVTEDRFPWLMIEQAVPVAWANMKYPRRTGDLREDTLVSHEALAAGLDVSDPNASPADAGKLKEHALVTTAYEMPTEQHPHGRVVVFSPKQNVILDVQESLPYRLHGEPHHGIVFFHYHRLPNRFFSKGVVEDLVGPQRQKNRARSQMIELKDRNLGRVYARKGTITASNKPVGKIMELIEIPLHADYPQETTGGGIGPWVENEARINDEDMQLVAGMRDVSFGNTPSGVVAYSALALLADQDNRRVGPTLKRVRGAIGDMMILALELARRYWQDGKQMALAGPDGDIELLLFRRAQLPVEFYVDVARHAPLPTSPAVEAQKIFDIFNAATSAGQPLPIEWLKSSLDAGRALPIPKQMDEVHFGKAETENILLAQGQPVFPSYYDDDYLHVMIHRNAQIEQMSNPQTQQLFEMHIQMHSEQAAMKKPSSAQGGANPMAQGGHGIEAQNGNVTSQQGLAQTAAGDAPMQ